MVLKGTELKTIETEVTLSRNSVPTFINAESSFEGCFNKGFPGKGTGKSKISRSAKGGMGMKEEKVNAGDCESMGARTERFYLSATTGGCLDTTQTPGAVIRLQ